MLEEKRNPYWKEKMDLRIALFELCVPIYKKILNSLK
jgi:hypothetical protein